MSKILQWDGRTITKPGIYKGIPLDLYHSSELFDGVPAISSSGLRTIWNKSAAHYWARSPYNPAREEDADEKRNLVLGRALHHLVGAEKGFHETFVIRPDALPDIGERIKKPWHGNRTACKEWLKTQKEAGRTVLSSEDVEQLSGMALSLGKHPLVTLLSGQIEHSYLWRDAETGIWLKWRPDSSPADSMDFVDLKGTPDVRHFKLKRTVNDFGYHMQGALGRWACRELLGREMSSFALFFVEWKNPWCTSLMEVLKDDLALGERQNRAALRRFWECWKSKEWPGPDSGGVGTIAIPDKDREYQEKLLDTMGA
jgi:hypothetical protein